MKAAPPIFPFPDHKPVEMRGYSGGVRMTVMKGWWPSKMFNRDMAGRIIRKGLSFGWKDG